MKIQYELKFWDFFQFSVAHNFLNPVAQACYLLVPGIIFSSMRDDGSSMGASVFAAVLMYAGEWGALLVIIAFGIFSKPDVNALTQHTIEATQEEIVEATPFTKLTVRWPGVHKVVSRPGFTGVYVAPQQAHIIPNRAFSSAAERREFVNFVQERIRTAKTQG